MVYACRFQQIAATLPGTPWARRDGDLWNVTLDNSQRRPYCRHCFGSTHTSKQCCGAPDAATKGRALKISSSDLRDRSPYGLLDSFSGSKPGWTAHPMSILRYGRPKLCW